MKGCEGYDIEEKQEVVSGSRQTKAVLLCGVFVESLHLSALCHRPAPEIVPELNAVTKIRVRV